MLCFGEIDCRAHLLKQTEIQKRSLSEVVKECVERYTSVVREIMNMGYEVLIWNVPASTRDDLARVPEFPTYGSCAERNKVTGLFNHELERWCAANDAVFVSIFDQLVDENGLTKTEYYMDPVHLSQRAMPLVLEKLREIIGDIDFHLPPGHLQRTRETRLAVVTPSYIGSRRRLEFARASLASLRDALGADVPHVVVDDRPRIPFRPLSWLPNLRALKFGRSVYAGPGVTLVRRWGRGSRGALLRAVREARARGAEIVFIHLDDNVYIPRLRVLLEHTCDAFARVPELAEVRLSGYPILCGDCDAKRGNRTLLRISSDEVAFDRVRLRPDRQEVYTLWWSTLEDEMVEGKYWPFALWSSAYRADFLERLLDAPEVRGMRAMGEVELFYKDGANWRRALQAFGGRIGYINMQFCGIEMQRNRNWRELTALPNTEVR